MVLFCRGSKDFQARQTLDTIVTHGPVTRGQCSKDVGVLAGFSKRLLMAVGARRADLTDETQVMFRRLEGTRTNQVRK